MAETKLNGGDGVARDEATGADAARGGDGAAHAEAERAADGPAQATPGAARAVDGAGAVGGVGEAGGAGGGAGTGGAGGAAPGASTLSIDTSTAASAGAAAESGARSAPGSTRARRRRYRTRRRLLKAPHKAASSSGRAHLFIALDELGGGRRGGGRVRWRKRHRWNFSLQEDVLDGRWGTPHLPRVSLRALAAMRSRMDLSSVAVGLRAESFDHAVDKMLRRAVMGGRMDEDAVDHALEVIELHARSEHSDARVRDEVASVASLEEDDDDVGLVNLCAPAAQGAEEAVIILVAGVPWLPPPADEAAGMIPILDSPSDVFCLARMEEPIETGAEGRAPTRWVCLLLYYSESVVAARGTLGSAQASRDSKARRDAMELGRAVATMFLDDDFATCSALCEDELDLLASVDRFMSCVAIVPHTRLPADAQGSRLLPASPVADGASGAAARPPSPVPLSSPVGTTTSTSRAFWVATERVGGGGDGGGSGSDAAGRSGSGGDATPGSDGEPAPRRRALSEDDVTVVLTRKLQGAISHAYRILAPGHHGPNPEGALGAEAEAQQAGEFEHLFIEMDELADFDDAPGKAEATAVSEAGGGGAGSGEAARGGGVDGGGGGKLESLSVRTRTRTRRSRRRAQPGHWHETHRWNYALQEDAVVAPDGRVSWGDTHLPVIDVPAMLRLRALLHPARNVLLDVGGPGSTAEEAMEAFVSHLVETGVAYHAARPAMLRAIALHREHMSGKRRLRRPRRRMRRGSKASGSGTSSLSLERQVSSDSAGTDRSHYSAAAPGDGDLLSPLLQEEAMDILVAHVEFAERGRPIVGLVRLDPPLNLGQQRQAPVRFVFVLFGNPRDRKKSSAIGQAVAALMLDDVFVARARRASTPKEFVAAVDSLLDAEITAVPHTHMQLPAIAAADGGGGNGNSNGNGNAGVARADSAPAAAAHLREAAPPDNVVVAHGVGGIGATRQRPGETPPGARGATNVRFSLALPQPARIDDRGDADDYVDAQLALPVIRRVRTFRQHEYRVKPLHRFTAMEGPTVTEGLTVANVLMFVQKYSIPLLLGVVVALVAANVDKVAYDQVWLHSLGLSVFGHDVTPLFIVNDVIMVFNFALATKEITEACLPRGALNPISRALSPMLATIGGVGGPILCFYAIESAMWSAGAYDEATYGPDVTRSSVLNGWGVPTATDIVLAWMTSLFVFGKGHPAIMYLILLAVADDALGLLIIALFCEEARSAAPLPSPLIRVAGVPLTHARALRRALLCDPRANADPDPQHPLQPAWLVLVPVAVGIAYVLRRNHVQSWPLYVLFAGPFSWIGLLKASLHPALALVPIVPFMPADTTSGVGAGMSEANSGTPEGRDSRSALIAFGRHVEAFMTYGLGLFSAANAAVVIGGVGPMTIGVLVALVVGKTVGITAMALLGRAAGVPLPEGVTTCDLVLVGFIASLGLTVALFVSGVAFDNSTALGATLQDEAKMGALMSILVAPVAIVLGKGLGLASKAVETTSAEPHDEETGRKGTRGGAETR